MSLLDELLTSAVKSSYENNKRKDKEPSILGALKDPQFLQDMKRGVLDSVNRGAVASTIGGPVDLATMALRPLGYNVEKPAWGSEWVGDKMQQLGLLGDYRNPVAEALASVAVPGAMTKAGQGLFKAEQAAIQNANIAGPLSGGKFASQRGVFGGINAKTADKAKLAQAEQMLNKGVDPAQVWKETGWGRGPDGKWRFEISDDAAKLVNVPVNKSWEQFANAAETEKYGRRGANVSSMSAKEFKDFKKWRAGLEDEYNKTNATMRPLSEIFQHEQAASAYPDVYNPLSAHWDASMGKNGSFGNGKIAFGDVSNQEGVKGLFGHELQHAIQQREGFARGGSPDSTDPAVVEAARKIYADNIKDFLGEGHELLNMARNHAYQRLGGEAEARLVQSRMNLTPEERAAQYPWNPDYFKQQTGVGLDDLIHRFDGGDAKHIPDWAQQEALKRLQAMQRGENVPSVIKGGLLTTDAQKDGLNSAYSLLTQGKQPPYQKNAMDLNIGHIYDARVSGKLKQSGKYADSFDPTDVVPWMARAGDDSATVGVKRGVPSLQNQFTDPQTGETFMVSLPVSSDFATGKQWVSGLIPEGKFKK